MFRDFTTPADSPALVLAEAVRRRCLRYSRTHVRAAVERHPQPTSLLAVVEVAPGLGLKPTAGQGDLETLDAAEPAELPAILHFAGDGAGGFGLLEAVLPGGAGLRIWDSLHGSRVMPREELASLWSGIVVFLERGAPGAPEPGYLGRRAREWLLEEWQPRFELSGRAASPGVRWGLGALLALLLGLAVWALPPEARAPGTVLSALSALGLGASLVALAWTRGAKATVLCGGGGAVDCESVLASDWARVGGVPLSGLGTAFFGASLLVQASAALSGGVAPVWLAGAAFLLALPVSLALVAVQVRMRRFCTLCMAVHAVDVGGALAFLLWLAPRVPPPPLLALVPAALLLVLLFGLLLSSTVPLLARGEEDDSLRQDWGRLQRSPLTSLARLSFERPLALALGTLGVPVGRAEAPHTLVVLAHPSCKLCGPALEELTATVARHPEVLRLHVGLAPVDPEDARDAAVCEALVSVGVAHGADVFLQSMRAAKPAFARLLTAPEPLAELCALTGLERSALEPAREAARARVREAAALKAAHAHGIPSFFFDGRPCTASPAHIEAWCARPGLLAVLAPPEAGAPSSQDTSGAEPS
ncbi:MAG TPA: vitamin K epoxide reductase family protein [Myxococcaceae bacterium]|jgi:uncharacterized membrane protein